MIIQAFAKINWSLDITGVREDGYHLMDMLMQPVSLADEITLTPADAITITTGGFPPSRADETNLAWRAAAALKNVAGYPGGVNIHVQKAIPIGAGMGGGSSDAAAVLYGLNRLWKTGLSSDALEQIGLSLGADVPFALRGGLSRTRGIGEILENYEYKYNYWLVIIQPCAGLSTAKVFSLWKEEVPAVRPDTEMALSALETGDFPKLCESIGNVLQPVACILRPEIEKACSSLLQEGASAARMTGSGSAVFGVFRNASAAEKAFKALSRTEKTIFLCHTQHDSLRILDD
jgi:4-diphosphocytidyl-2-C-methyl-D-erythritol kinase